MMPKNNNAHNNAKDAVWFLFSLFTICTKCAKALVGESENPWW